jgi:hypothetical protein
MPRTAKKTTAVGKKKIRLNTEDESHLGYRAV